MTTLEELIKQYQQGDSESGEEILRKLSPLEKKYIRFIQQGLGDYSEGIRHFVSALNHPRGSGAGIEWMVRKARQYSTEEIQQEIRISILECVYTKPYFFRYFTRILARNLIELFGGFIEEVGLDENRYPSPVEVKVWDIDYFTDEEKDLIRLYLEYDLETELVAEELGIHRTTVQRRLRRIFDKIDEEIEDNESRKNK